VDTRIWSQVLEELCSNKPTVSVKLSKRSVVEQHLSGNLYKKFVEEEGDVFVTLRNRKEKLYVGTFMIKPALAEEMFELVAWDNVYEKFSCIIEPLVLKSDYSLSFLSDSTTFTQNLYQGLLEVIREAINNNKYSMSKYQKSRTNISG